jgi:hypothetical protein
MTKNIVHATTATALAYAFLDGVLAVFVINLPLRGILVLGEWWLRLGSLRDKKLRKSFGRNSRSIRVLLASGELLKDGTIKLLNEFPVQ